MRHDGLARVAALGLGLGLLAASGCKKAPATGEAVTVAAAADLCVCVPGPRAPLREGDRTARRLLVRLDGHPRAADCRRRALRRVRRGERLVRGRRRRIRSLPRRLHARRTRRGASWSTSRPDAAVTPRALAELTDPRITRIAIANPEHAPYGRAAREAMKRAGRLGRGLAPHRLRRERPASVAVRAVGERGRGDRRALPGDRDPGRVDVDPR